MRKLIIALGVLAVLGAVGFAARPANAPARAPTYTYHIVNTYPHDPKAFTEGLVFHGGGLFESTGLYGFSSLRKVELDSGRVLKKMDVPAQYFAEGLTLFNGRLLQLTWQQHLGFRYDSSSFRQLGTFDYTGEGWGLTHDGSALIMSDGTNRLRFLDPTTFKVLRSISVTDRGAPVDQLNELEFYKGEILANVFETDRIVRVDPKDGTVTGWINLAGLFPKADRVRRLDVLNGIAYDAKRDRLFVTGKDWPKLFEIELKAAKG